jgi:hypothetical protein
MKCRIVLPKIVQWGRTFGTAATVPAPGDSDGNYGEIGEITIGRENLTQRHFDHHKSHMTRPGFEPGPPRWEASD